MDARKAEEQRTRTLSISCVYVAVRNDSERVAAKAPTEKRRRKRERERGREISNVQNSDSSQVESNSSQRKASRVRSSPVR